MEKSQEAFPGHMEITVDSASARKRLIKELCGGVAMNGDRCNDPMIEIEHYGDQLIGCIDCNCWKGSGSAFIVDLSRRSSGAPRWSANVFSSTTTHGKRFKPSRVRLVRAFRS